MSQLNLYPNASTIDAVNDELVIWTNSLSAVQNINRNTFLNLSSQPVGLTDSQTLTNKTLTSPTINGATLSGTLSGTYTIGGTPTFPASVTQNTTVQTLTNKTLTSPTINSPTITNATISADTLTGYTVSNTGTIYGIPVTTGTMSASYLTASTITNTQIAAAGLYTTKVYNPYKFNVYRNAALTDGNNAYVQIIFDTKVYDTGTNYSTSTGLFTAPIAGFYQFNWVISKIQTANTAMLSSLFVNAEATARATSNQSYQGATTGGGGTSGATIIQLSANDTVQIKSYGSGGAIQVGLVVYASTSFSGFLVSAT